jgi:hypothetical protein
MRKTSLLTLAAALLLVAVSVPAAQAKTLKVNWNERYSFAGSGFLTFHVTRIVVTPNTWQVAMSVANNSSYTLDLSRPPIQLDSKYLHYLDPTFKGWGGCGETNLGKQGFGLAKYAYKPAPDGGRGYGGFLTLPWTHAKPSFPSKLKPNDTWTGTYSGAGRVPRTTELRLCFGLFTISSAPDQNKSEIGTYFSWMTRHKFQL